MDIVCCDFLYSLFVSAAINYKKDSLLRPFPALFLKEDNEKDFDALIEAARRLPPLHQIDWKNTDHINPQSILLLKWVINPKSFHLTLADRREFSNFVRLVDDTSAPSEPDFLFEVVYGDKENERFMKQAEGHDIIHAYHGSKCENFHSILYHGLRNNLNKVAFFGEGIYLSSDFKVSILYSPASTGWTNSLFGDSLSCLALCEAIDHPDVKCSKTEDASKPTLRSRSSRSHIKGSEGGEIPEKYFIVRNDELVRVKYVAVYAPKADKKFIASILAGTPTFFSRHRFLILMLLYVGALFLIGFFNSSVFNTWWRSRIQHDD
uniref:Poly [ADP-ribose] polymerase n=1 Tax=Ciona savignyi TaxID=51511 RepID=H2YF11_CIOSA